MIGRIFLLHRALAMQALFTVSLVRSVPDEDHSAFITRYLSPVFVLPLVIFLKNELQTSDFPACST